MTDTRSAPLLSVRDLSVRFDVADGAVHAVRDVSLDLRRGEVLALVGESGSGKSTAMLAVMGLLSPNARVSGSARLDGTELIGAGQADLRLVRGRRVAMIFQDPMTSLNPVLSVGRQMTEAIRVHRRVTPGEARERAIELLELVAIPRAAERLASFPHELSGGMRQRVMIAMAMANDPDVLIADEPTTALDVTIQAQVIEVLQGLRQSRELAIVLVTHDLGVVAGLADTVAVMYAGAVAEIGDVRDVFRAPSHPYTQGLLACSPRLDAVDDLQPIPGNPPVLAQLPTGCPFAPRCARAISECTRWRPVLQQGPATLAACIHVTSSGGHR